MTNDQVWWDMEDVVARFESEDKYPVDLAVEDRSTAARKTNFSKLPEIGERISPGFAFLPPRFMAGSEMLLAANHGNKYSIAIEVNTRLPFLPLPAPIHPRWPVHPLSITICGRSSRRPSPTIGATTGTKDELNYISGQVG